MKNMEFTQEAVDALEVNEVEIMKKIADELNIRVQQVSAVISLFNEDCTVAFISRYRKDKTGNLDEVQVLAIDHSFKSYKNLEERRLAREGMTPAMALATAAGGTVTGEIIAKEDNEFAEAAATMEEK